MPKHGPPTKKCKDCKRFYEHEHFWKSSVSKDGLKSFCIPCGTKRNANHHEAMKVKTKIIVTEKYCYGCKWTRPADDFTINRACRDNLDHFCRKCKAARHHKWAKECDTPERRRDVQAKLKYGLTPDELQQMIDRQKNICAICQKGMGRRPCIDHDHVTGAVRELLCNRCNPFLAALEDPAFFVKASAYLGKHAELAKLKPHKQQALSFVL